MFKCAGTFQVSFTAVNVFLLSAPDFGVFVWELLTPVNPSLRRDDVNRHLQLKISALCVCLMYLCLLLPLTLCALCTSAYCYHWHCVPCRVPLPAATTDTVCLMYLCLLLPLTLCALCTSAYCHHWHCVPCVSLPTATTDTVCLVV